MPTAFLNAIGTAAPAHDIHQAFVAWATARLPGDRERRLFARMAQRAGIQRRGTVLPMAANGDSPIAEGGFYALDPLPPTSARMAMYAEHAPRLAIEAITALAAGCPLDGITHLVVASCTGFTAPGIDQIIASKLGLDGGIERTLIGFMGCYAAVAALRTAHHIVRSEPAARVLVVTVELSTLHMQGDCEVERLLAQLQFADGAAAALVTGEAGGFALERFFSATLPESHELIQWRIGDQGFAMLLSGEVPARIGHALADPALRGAMLGDDAADAIGAWAVHAGGRSILDAVEQGFALGPDALADSRAVLAEHGNMSSATLLFGLERLLADPARDRGLALAFGPGLAAEGFRFARA